MNPKKYAFGVTKGRFLGHIISKDEIKIDPRRVATIDEIPIPKIVKEIHSFFG